MTKMLRTRSRKSSVISSLPSYSTTGASSSGSSNSLSSLSHHKQQIVSNYWKHKYCRRQPLRCLQLAIMIFCAVVLVVATTLHVNQSRSSSLSSSSSSSSLQQNGDRSIMTQQQLGMAPLLATTADYDMIICGSGPAGLTAGIFAARIGLNVLITGSIASSQLAESVVLENFPSSFITAVGTDAATNSVSNSNSSNNNNNNKPMNTGEAWLLATQQQAAAAGVQFAAGGMMVTKIEKPPSPVQQTQDSSSSSNYSNSVFTVVVEQRYTITARSIILATGATSRRLELLHETQLWGKGVHSCAICDGPSYQDRIVVVVGGGDAAVEAALLLAQHATTVMVVHRRNEFRASDVAGLQALRQLQNVHMETPFRVIQYETKSITTDNANPREQLQLTGVTIENVETKTTKTIPCDGVFVMIGSTPNTQLVRDLVDLDPVSGLVVASTGSSKDSTMMMTTTATSVPGIFAAGQITDDRYKQAITAAAAGAQAALHAERWLRQQQRTIPVRQQQHQHLNKHISPVPLQRIKTPLSKNDKMPQTLSDAALPETASQIAAVHNDCSDLAKQECITALVKAYPVVVFSKPWCGYCRRALEKLALEGVSSEPYLHIVNLGSIDNFRAIQNTLFAMTGRRTVPNVFIGGTSIGGGDETVALSRDGKLRPLLEKAGALPQPQQGVKMIPKENQQQVERVLSNTLKETAIEAAKTDCSDLSKQECITALVKAYPVVVFSISWCNKCHRALEKLAVEGVSSDPHLYVVNLDMTDNNIAIRNTLFAMTGRHGVPYIFIGGTIIGGGDEVTALYRDGKLRPSLEKAGALPGGAELCDLVEEACIAFVVQKYPVVVFSKHYCPYCKRALEALKLEGLTGEPSLRVIDLTQLEHGANIQNTLQKMTGRRTVPNVFVGGTSLGGGDEISALHRAGNLKTLLDEAHAFEKTVRS